MSKLKRAVLRSSIVWFSLSVCPLGGAAGPAGNPSAATDGKQRLLQAAAQNSLVEEGMKPWHLRVLYTVADAAGHPRGSGTIEELWGGTKLRRLDIRGDGSEFTRVQNEKGTYQEGEINQRVALLLLVERAFVQPVSITKESSVTMEVASRVRAVGSSSLSCITISGRGLVAKSFRDPAYCVETTDPILRVVSFPDDGSVFTRNKIGKFDDHYVPTEIAVATEDGTSLLARLESLTQIDAFPPDEFAPGAKAQLVADAKATLVLTDGMLDKMIEANQIHPIFRPQPSYPSAAPATQDHGTVVVRARIGVDGRMRSVRVVKGPPTLRQAALDAVWRWRFEPYCLNHEPSEVLAMIAVRM